MPNDCYNYLEAPEGDVSLIADYISTRKQKYVKLPETYLNFHKIIPSPSPKGMPNESWADQHWGTKWNSYDGNVQDEGMSFYTAWSPPAPVIGALAKLINKPLRLLYDEGGMDFCGEVLAQPDGTYTDTCYSPRSEAPEELKEDLMIDEDSGFIF